MALFNVCQRHLGLSPEPVQKILTLLTKTIQKINHSKINSDVLHRLKARAALSRGTKELPKALSVVEPIRYAHLAAVQLGTFMKCEHQFETSLSHGGVRAPGPVSVAQIPKLKDNVANPMFLC